MDNLRLSVEGLIFAAQQPISVEDIKACLDAHMNTTFETSVIEQAIEATIEKFQHIDSSIEVVEISGGFTLMTKGSLHTLIGTHLKQITNKKLSRAAMETLAILAYKQPVTKGELESIRGVNCDYSIQKLLDKDLIEIKGRSEGLGKPLIYGTSDKFMDYFGLKSMDDLPKLSDFELPDNSIGLPSESLDTENSLPLKSEEE